MLLQVSTKYQHQLVHVYILIEQVDPNPQIKADLTEIFTVRRAMMPALSCACRVQPSQVVVTFSFGGFLGRCTTVGTRARQSATCIVKREGGLVRQL